MADNQRETELVIRAKDLGAKTLKEVASNILAVTDALDGQIEAAKRGDVSAAALEKTLKGLKDANAALIKQQGLVDLYEKTAAALAAAEVKATETRAAFEALQAAQAKNEAVTKKDEKALVALGKAADGAEKKLDTLRASVASQSATLEKAGVDVTNLARAQELIVASSQAAGAAFTTVSGVLDNYEANIRGAREAEAALAASDAFSAKLAEAQRLGQAINIVQFWREALGEARVAEAGFADTVAFDEKLRDARKAREAAEYIQFYTQALNQAEVAERELSQLNAFRQVADQAVAGAKGLEAFSTEAVVLEGSASRMAASLRTIIDPAGAALGSLDGLEERVAAITAQVGNADKPIREYQDAINELGRVQSALLKQAADVDAFNNQAVAVKRAEEAYTTARQRVLDYAEAIRAADAPNDELTASLRQAEAALAAAGKELENESARALKLRGALQQAGIGVKDLASAEARLTSATTATAGAMSKLDAAQKGTNSRAGTFLGLKPYELQNLSFQINDVFTQLASGTSITQTFAQQGGQIVQLFPRLLAGFVTFLPIIAPVAIAVGVLAAAFKRLYDEASSVQTFTAILAASASGSQYQADALAKSAQALDAYGLSLKDARKLVTDFVNAGLDQDKIVAFGETAKDMARVLGIDVPDAAAKMTEGLLGGYEEVVKLDDSLDFLTEAQRAQIQAMFDSGDAAGAQELAFKALHDRFAAGAAAMDGPWSQALRNFAGAWDNLLKFIGNLDIIKNTVKELEWLAKTAQWATSFLPGATKGPGAKVVTPAAPARTAPAGPSSREVKAAADINRELVEQRVNVEKLDSAERKRLAGLKAVRAAESKGVGDAGLLAQIRANAEQTEQFKITKEANTKAAAESRKAGAAARREAAAQRKLENEAKAAENKRKSIESGLINDLNQLDASVGRQQKTSLQDQLDAIDSKYQAINQAIKKFQDAGGKTIDGQSIAAFEARVEADKEQLKHTAQLAFYEDSIEAIQKKRDASLASINDKLADGAISASEAYELAQKAQDELAPQIAQMAKDALAFAEGLNEAKPTPALAAFIEQMKGLQDRELRATPQNSPDAKFGKQALGTDETKLNEIISERNNLVSSYNALVTAGALTQKQADELSAAAYARALPAIQAQSAEVLKLLNLLKAQGAITETTYDAWIAKLQEVNAQATFQSQAFTQVHDLIVNQLAQGGVTAIESVANAIGQAVAGTASWGDALNSLWRSAAQFAADFLKSLADLILQMLVLQAIKSLPFLNGLTSGIMQFTGLATGSAALAAAGSTVLAGSAALGVSAAALQAAASTLLVANSIKTASAFHSGGVVGRIGAGTRRTGITAATFAGAPRYHNGTVVGLRSDEQAAILQKGEEVLKKNDPRNVMNGGAVGSSGAGAAQSIRNVLVFDENEIPGAMQNPSGERVVMSFVRKNAAAIKQMLR